MTKNDIIKAAFRVWGREFYQTTSLSELARELGASKAALYRHFKDKQALLDAMNDSFLDEFTAFIRVGYEKALASLDMRERCLIMIRIISEFYGKNVDAFIFGMFQILHTRQTENISAQMIARGLDFGALSRQPENSGACFRDPASFPLTIQLIMASNNFWVARFHHCDRKANHKSLEIPTDEAVKELIAGVEKNISSGLMLSAESVDGLDYSRLEKIADSIPFQGFIDLQSEDSRIFQAIAEVVAEAGPWNASMEMVARRLDFAKSSLYAHFKNKQDMLGKFFITEAGYLVKYAGEYKKVSNIPEEQLYLALISIAAYLRSRREILFALNWLHTRLPEIGPKLVSEKRRVLPGIYRIITDIDLPVFKTETGDKKDNIARWIFFLIMSSLMRHPENGLAPELSNGSQYIDLNQKLRMLYRFIGLGLEGFIL
ncbi:MAG: TetR family transcriptional regulator [Treponema sp.]|jgi:AcrR family transcriptional regulator|nr:TetR family transcriptional regulator [Treponema sp.]